MPRPHPARLPARRIAAAGIAAFLLLSGRPAAAADGRIEINQVCAVHTGCGPLDAPGFPVAIGSGSHVLTGNLLVAGASSAIIVEEPHAWIDLRGFTIQGPNACNLPGPVCAQTDGGTGIASQVPYTTVRNGTIRGFGAHGLQLRDRCRIENVTVSENGRFGVWASGHGCLIRRVRSVRNGTGIASDGHGVLVENVAEGNALTGIATLQGSVVAANSADGNGAGGIAAGVGGNAVHENRARRNGQWGIVVGRGSIATGNAMTENATLGFEPNGAGYGFNVIRTDPAVPGSSTVGAGAKNLGNNICNGVPPCP